MVNRVYLMFSASFAFSLFQSYEVFKHRELGILSRRPPLQWCQELRYLTDPEKLPPVTTTTSKSYSSLSGHFMKKYEKYLRKDSTIANSNDASYRKSHNDITIDNNYQRTHSDNNFQSQTVSDKSRFGIKYGNDDSKRVYYEKLWPKTNNLQKKLVKPTEEPETDLTALASFPVSICHLNIGWSNVFD